MILDSKFTSVHLHSDFPSAAQISLLTKSYKVSEDQPILQNCFNSFSLPCLEYCSVVWCSAADSHPTLLD